MKTHLVLSGGSGDRASPYATTHALSYKPYTVTSDVKPFDYFPSAYHSSVVNSRTSSAFQDASTMRSSFKASPVPLPPQALPRYVPNQEPAFFPTEEGTAGRIMPPPDKDPAARFAAPPRTVDPAPTTFTRVDACRDGRQGGFNKANMGPVVEQHVSPAFAAGMPPSLTYSQQQKLVGDSAARMALGRDFSDKPFLTSTAFFLQDSIEMSKARVPPTTQTAWQHDQTEPVWISRQQMPWTTSASAVPGLAAPTPDFLPCTEVKPSAFARSIQVSADAKPGAASRSSLQPERLRWKVRERDCAVCGWCGESSVHGEVCRVTCWRGGCPDLLRARRAHHFV
jgi:hypothetical protein